jgi:hypothetical protein
MEIAQRSGARTNGNCNQPAQDIGIRCGRVVAAETGHVARGQTILTAQRSCFGLDARMGVRGVTRPRNVSVNFFSISSWRSRINCGRNSITCRMTRSTSQVGSLEQFDLIQRENVVQKASVGGRHQ